MNTIFHEIGEAAKAFRRNVLIANVCLILLGLLLLLVPQLSSNLICRAVGILLSILGVIRIIEHFTATNATAFSSFSFVQGVALLGFGVYFLIRPGVLAAFLTVALAIAVILGGAFKVQYSLELRRLNASGWWVELIGAAAMVILGIIAIANPFQAAVGLTRFIGIAFLISGIWDLISIAWLSTLLGKVRQDVRQAKQDRDAIETEGTVIDDD